MTTKLETFIKRNRIRNAKLYQLDLIEGIDYIVCPVSKERLMIIRTDYITKILEMSVAEYDQKFPNTQKRCQAHQNNIKSGLHMLDPATGLTKYQLSQVKAREKLKAVDENGVSGYKKKGQKTRETHMTTIDFLGRNGYRRQADLRLCTILPNGMTVEQNAHLKQKETLFKNNKTGSGGASKQSKKVLFPILDFLTQQNIKFYFDSHEYGIKDTDTGNHYFWDLTIPTLNIAIEYQSSAWHADPSLTESEWNSWSPPKGRLRTPDEVLTYDYNKARSLYKHRGIVTYYVWQKTQEQDTGDILCLIQTLNMKS